MGDVTPMAGVYPVCEGTTDSLEEEGSPAANGWSDAIKGLVGEYVSGWASGWTDYVPQVTGGTPLAPAGMRAVGSLGWQSEDVYPAQGIDKLEIYHPSGAVRIMGADTDQITVRTRKVSGDGNCYSELQRDGGSFVINNSHSTFFDINDCTIDMELVVPRTLAMEAKIGFSHLQLSGMEGDISINLGSGTVQGNVSSENTHLELGQGVVNLSWDRAHDDGNIDLKAGSATITLSFPQGTTLNPQVKTGLARFANALPHSSDANFDVTAKLGMGGLTFQYR